MNNIMAPEMENMVDKHVFRNMNDIMELEVGDLDLQNMFSEMF